MRRLHLFIALFILLLPLSGRAETDKYIFEHLHTSNHWINDIFQDSDGFIWVASRNGLYRYLGDGPAEYEAIRDGFSFHDINQDSEGMIWVMSGYGLVAYDPKTHVFYEHDQVSRFLEADAWVDCFDIDDSGFYWWNEEGNVYVKTSLDEPRIHIGQFDERVTDIYVVNRIAYVLTAKGDVFRYTLETDGQVRTFPVLSITGDLTDNAPCHKILVDSSQNIWIAHASEGVWLFRYGSTRPVFMDNTSSAGSILPGYVNSLIEDKDGNVWFASDHGGITICDKSGTVLTKLVNIPGDANSLASNGVYALCCDREGNVWVGYTKMGLSVYRGENKIWSMSHLRSLHDNDLRDDINTVCEDNDGNLWFGTDGCGLVRMNPQTGSETVYTKENSLLGSDVITDLHCDPAGRIWIGTFYGGMSCIENGRMRTWKSGPDALVNDNVWTIDNDESGRIWIGVLGGGVQVLDPVTGHFVNYNYTNDGLSNDSVQELKCADDGKVYVATGYGFSVIDSHTGSVEVISLEDLSQSTLTGVMVDSRGLVWLDEAGILRVYDPASNRFYTPRHSALRAIRGIIEGDDKTVWVVTDNGICMLKVYRSLEEGYAFDVSSFSFSQNADLHFNQRSLCMTRDGDFVIGTFSGYMRFRQEMFLQEQQSHTHQAHFISLYVGNQKVEPMQEYHGKVILDHAIEYTDELVLSHDMAIISLQYSCLDYLSVHDVPLYYRMEGLSDEWIMTDRHSGRITFTNLAPGRYTLRLTPDISDLEKVQSLDIRVLPPWWISWWAILVYLVFAASVTAVAMVIVSRRRREKKERIELSIKQEKRHYLDEMKMEFFTNVSHDFRTPLTLILTPVEDLLAKNPEMKNDNFIMTIHRNARYLLNLVNEVLDMRRIETYGTHLNMTSNDIVSVLKAAIEPFRLMADSQNIELNLISDMDSLVFSFDSRKIQKVLTNLLSNAFKFTPAGGYIHVVLNVPDEELVRIEIRDSGSGVPDKEKKRIFDRFYQPKDSPAGSGIGLHVVREFVTLHGGEVEVRDNEPVGSVFSFTLPVGSTDESVNVVDDEDDAGQVEVQDERSGHSTVLIVDDNDDFRTFMCASFSDEYKVFAASDGSEAIKIVENNDIDVVISDVMMPVMDGNELCRRMKSDINTSHIPIILLTAKAMQDDEYSGLESGADDYLVKPFNMSILRLRVSKFIEWKKRSKRMFEKELEVATEQITITTMDDRLLQQAINVINENIGNPDFSVAELSAALCMHRTSLYKKLVYITGKTPVEFIRSMRLKRAAVLLETDGVYVSEIAYMVGFNSPKVFASHFKDEFGCSPTDYRRRQGLNR